LDELKNNPNNDIHNIFNALRDNPVEIEDAKKDNPMIARLKLLIVSFFKLYPLIFFFKFFFKKIIDSFFFFI
jgi:hypothetical protein